MANLTEDMLYLQGKITILTAGKRTLQLSTKLKVKFYFRSDRCQEMILTKKMLCEQGKRL